MKNAFRHYQYFLLLIISVFYFFFYERSAVSYLVYSVTSPVADFASRVWTNVTHSVLKARELSSLKKENELMKSLLAKKDAEIRILRTGLLRAKQAGKEFDFINRSDAEFLGTFPVITFYRLFDKWFFVLNCGEKDGIRKGDFLSFQGNLTGRISKAGFATCVADFITNEGIVVDGIVPLSLSDTGSNGISEVSILGFCAHQGSEFIFSVLAEEPVEPERIIGEPVFSGHLSKQFGQDFIIGEIGALIRRDINKYTFSVNIPYEPRKIRYLSVFRKKHE